jgi:hypothetical protein
MVLQPSQQAVHSPYTFEHVEDQPDHVLHLLIGIHLVITVGGADIAHGRVVEHFPTPRFVPRAFLHSTLENVQLRFAHRPF